jgi:iron complex outermembrane recepter protein
MNRILWLFSLVISCFSGSILAQEDTYPVLISGRVVDQSTMETVIGARVILVGTAQGSLTDLDGQFTLNHTGEWPITLQVESTGFETKLVEVADSNRFVEVVLAPQQPLANAVVVSASRVEERILEAPVSIRRQGVLDLRYKVAPRVHDALSNMPGLLTATSSLVYQSPNTRGFGNVQNWRFLQLIDGVDVSGPGVNYAVGSAMTGAELDVRTVEVVPGPGSALYGANAFNGILSTRTKSPWDYPGLSAYLRQGFMVHQNQEQQPMSDLGFRFAKVFNDQWAFKVNVSYLSAIEWQANDQQHLITNADVPMATSLLARDLTHPNYNAVNVYGDETQAMVDLTGDGSLVPVNRSGIDEEALRDHEVQSLTVNASLHHRITDDLEAIYDYRYAQSDAIIRYDNFYPFENYEAYFHKLELRGKRFFVRAFYGTDNPGDGYSMLQAGAIVQEGLKPTEVWGADYGAAFRGEVPGVAAGNHAEARRFADRELSDNPEGRINELLELTRSVPIDLRGGSAVVYQSTISNLEVNYQFLEEIPWFNLQAGGNLRRYGLRSNGHVYNDGSRGFNDLIPVVEFGGYLQADRSLFSDRLKLRASIRYDKHQEFEGRFSPRASAVFKAGSANEHTFRVSGQTGFRNPANQDMYVAFNAGPLIYLGNAQSNIENFNFRTQGEVSLSGIEIYDQLVTLASFQTFMAGGGTDPNLLQPANLEFLQQEQITTAEAGYRTLLFNRVYFDLSGYVNWYQNFTANVVSFSPQAGIPFLTLNNVSETVYSYGSTASLDAVLPGDFHLSGSYTFTEFNAEDAIAANPNYFPDFNFPQHMVKGSFGNRDLIDGVGFQVDYRWIDNYLFQSPNGQALVPERNVIDAALFYHLQPAKCLLKVGATNLLNDPYTPVYGGPTIGGTYYFQVTFDELFQ